MSLKVSCLPSSAVGKQPCLHAWMPDTSNLCVMSGSQPLNDDDDDEIIDIEQIIYIIIAIIIIIFYIIVV